MENTLNSPKLRTCILVWLLRSYVLHSITLEHKMVDDTQTFVFIILHCVISFYILHR